jgi:predicted PurR-regulated permease PerM
MKKAIRSVSVWMLALVFTAGVVFQPSAMAANEGMVTTQQLLSQQQHSDNLAKVNAFMSQDKVQQMLTERGVNVDDAKMRIASLSDAELEQLSAQIDELPAGQGALGFLLFLLVFFMLLDIAGVTDIFPGV